MKAEYPATLNNPSALAADFQPPEDVNNRSTADSQPFTHVPQPQKADFLNLLEARNE